jgi:RNA polymerase sigma factor (sigma-70 family)
MADFFEDEESFVPGSSAEDYVDAGAEQEPTAIDTFSGNTGSDDFATMPEPSPQRRVVDIAPTPPRKPRLSGNPERLEEDIARVDDWVERTHQWEAREEAKVQKAEFEKSRRAHNVQARQISAATGAQFNYDADGVAQPRVNPQTGEQAFTKRTSPVRYDDQGRPFQIIQNEQGTQSERIADPDANADIGPNPEDPEDRFIYRKTKFQPWKAIDPEEGINSTDGRVVRASGKALFDREKTTLKRERDEISLSLRDPARPRRLSPEARQQVESELQGLSQAAPPPAQVKGMFGGVNVEATEAAKQKWKEGEAFRAGLLAEKQSLLAADDERAGLETRAYELDQNLFGLEKMPLSQFVQDRRQKKAQSLADLAPEAARAEMENRGAAIAEEDASTESAMQDLQRRSAALNERTKKGITIQEMESVAAERAAIEADAAGIKERIANRNAAAGEMMRGVEAIKAKESSKREESFAELDRQAAKYPELAEDAKAFRSVDADYRNRMAAVQEQPEGPGKQAAVDALNSEFQTKRKETGSAYVSKLEKRISGDVGAAIEKVAGPGGALGFKSQIAALEKDAEIDPDIKKIAVEVIRNQAVDALIRSNNLAAVKPAVNRPEGQDFSDAYKAAGYLNPENLEDRAKAAQILEQDPGLGAKLFDGFDRAMSTFGARIFGAVSVVGKAISYRLGLDPDNAFREASEAGYQVKLDTEKYREKFRDPRLETDDALNRWIMPAVSEALPNLAGMALTAIPAVGPALAVTYNIGQLYDEAYSQASQDASLTEDQKHNAASIYAALALPAETIGDIASGGIFTSRMIPKAAKRQSVEAAAKFWSKFTNVGEVWDKLPPILKRGVAIVAAGGTEGLTETAQDKILNATIETIKTGNIGDSVSKALADNRGALDTFIVASISGGGIKTLETATRTLIERGQNPEEMARRYNGVANSFRLENVLAFAQQTQSSFDTKEYNTLTQASEGLLMRLDRINPNDKVARNDVARELAQVEARRLTMISEILGKGTVDQAMGRTPQQRSAGTTPPQIRPENFAAMQAEIGQAAPERQAPLATAIKILSGAPMQSLTKAEQDAIKPHVAKIGGQTVLTDDILTELSQASPQAAALMQQGSIRDEATRRLEILSTEKEGGENNENQILQQSPENAGQGIQGYQNAGQDDQGVGKGPLTPGGAAGLPALPPLPVGRGGELISKKERKVADVIAARLAQGGAEQNAARAFSNYFIKRETLRGWGGEKLNAAVSEFQKAGGFENPQAILASVDASTQTQRAEIDNFTNEVLKGLDADPKAAGIQPQERAKVASIIRNQIAPSLLRYRPVLRGIVSFFDKTSDSDFQVNRTEKLLINSAAILTARGKDFWADTENADLIIDEEIAHISQIKVIAEIRRERTGEVGAEDMDLAIREAEEVFLQLPQSLQEASRKIYGDEKATPGQSGMEFFRQMLQGDIAISEGRVLDRNGKVISELAVNDRPWVEKMKAMFERLFKVFTNLRGNLGAMLRDEGRSDAEVEAITARVERIRKDSLKFFQNLKKEGDRIRGEAYGQEYARQTAQYTAAQPGGREGTGRATSGGLLPTAADGRPAPTPGGASGQLSPAQSPLGPDQAARLAELESREAERQAREERAKERRAEYVAKRAGDLKDYDKVVESTPEDAREPVRELLAQAPSGKAGYVLAVNQRRLPSTWVALPPGVVQTSHIGPTFQKNPEYAGQNTRAYDTDPAEQNKVRAGALPGALNEDILTSTDPSSANSAPQVAIVIDAAPDGQPRARWQAAGGNAREMMSNLAPQEDQDRLSQTWSEKGAQFGFEAMPEGFRGYRFLGVFDIRTTAGASDYQKLVDDLNPATGVVQDVSDRADLDAKNIPLDLVADLPVMMSGKQATEALSRILTAPGNIVERNRIEPMVKNPAQAQAYMQRMMFTAGLGQPKLTSKIADYQLQNRNAAFVEIAADAAKSAIALRQSGSPGIADAFGGLLSNVADYLDQDRSLKSALELAASQIEMDALVGDTAPAVEITKRLVELVVVDKRGRINSDATSEAMKDYMVALASGISRASEDAAMGDIFNEQPMTMAERIAAINAAHRRNAQPDSETTLSAPKNTSARRMRELERKRRQEGLNRYESDELARLEQSAGQQFMDFFEDTRDQRFELEQEVERRGIERAPVEQMSFVLNAPPSQQRIDAAAAIKSPAAVTQQAQQKAPIPAEDDPSRKKFQRFSSAAFQILQDGFKKAVDEDASNGYPGLPGFMPTKGLTREERIIEAHFAQQIARDPQKTLEDYIALSISDFGEEAEGRYLNADLARDVYAPYRNDPSMRPAMERATISPAGYIALNLGWNHWLKNTNAEERGTVVFMAGGMASGKTTAVQKAFSSINKKESAIFLDSVLGNFDRAEQMLAQVENAGFSPYMAFVFRPFESAAQAAIKRLQSTGRPVRLEQLGVAHYDSQKTFLKLYQKYGQSIPFVTILNEGSLEDIRREKGVDPLRARAYVNIEDETRNQRATETETQGPSGGNLGRATRQPQPGDGGVESQTRGQSAQGPLSALPEAAAKTRLTQVYADLIESAKITDWEKTAVLYGFIPPAQTTLSAARSRRKASDNQLDFDFSAPAVQDYKAALEADGITHPVAQAAAAQQDIGLPATEALDLFDYKPNAPAANPLTAPELARREEQSEPTNEQPVNTPAVRGNATPRKPNDPRGTQKPAPDTGLGELFQFVAGIRNAERDSAETPSRSGVEGGSGGGIPAVDGRQGDPAVQRSTQGSGRSGNDAGTLPVSGGLGGQGGRGDSKRAPRSRPRISQPGNGQRVERPPVGSPERNISLSRDQALAPRGTVGKLRANLAAIRIIQALDSEKRLATAEEKQELVKFSGWGALSQVFDEDRANQIERGEIEQLRNQAAKYRSYGNDEYYANIVKDYEDRAQALENWKSKWFEAHKEVKALLSDQEYRDARRSTINAHYTSPEIVAGMWDIVKWMGFKGGNILEPGAGIGHFFGLMPEDIADRSKLFGVELDAYTAKILKALYPEADIQNTGFQTADLADNSIDLAISNVPFANVPVKDPALEAMGGPVGNLHDYFFGKTLTKLKPGGMQVFITSAFTMDKGNPEIRKWLSERADLVAAYRLPNDAFRENAGTDVVTDIIILRKKDGKPFPHAQAWTNLDDAKTRRGEDIRINEYFAAHPQNILGQLDNDGSMYGDKKEMTVHGDPARPPDIAMQQDLARLPQGILGDIDAAGPVRSNATGVVKVGNIVERDGQFFRQGQNTPDAELNNAKTVPRVRRFLSVRDALNRQYDLELSETATPEEIEANRRELNAAYDRFISSDGYFHDIKNRKLFIDDPDYFRILGAEVEPKVNKGTSATVEEIAAVAKGSKKKIYTKADIFARRVLEPRSEPTQANTIEDAFGISLGWRGRVDSQFMAGLLGKTPEQVETQLLSQEIAVREPGTGRIFSREQYLSGNVRKKLAIARAAGPEYARNIRILEEVQPKRVSAEDIRFGVGATWIPAQIYNRFLQSLGVNSARFTYITANQRSNWDMERTGGGVSGVAYKDYETNRVPLTQMMDSLLNLKAITLRMPEKDGGGIDMKATTAAREKAKKLDARFQQWVRETPDVKAEVEEIYNNEVNAFVQRTYDGQFLQFPWANKDFDIYPDKKNTIWRALQEGFGLIAHGVGGGKTIIGSAIALEMRRLGMARKPMIVVHNSTLEGFAKEIAKMAPTARVLVGRKDELAGEKRKEFLMRIAAGDWDAVVIAHSTFGLIENDPQVEIRTSNSLKDEAEATLRERGYKSVAAAKEDRRKSPSVKALVKHIERLETIISEASKRRTDTGLLNFQQLGVDALIVDEVHEFKKMPFTTQLEAKGIDGSTNEKAYNLFMRARQIQEKTGGKNVFSMTGTPVTNTLGEIWNMARLVAPNVLREHNIELFDQFVSRFAQVTTEAEMGASGEFKNVDRLSRFVNLPEWNTFLRSAADVKLGDDLVVKNRPGIKGGQPELVAVPRTQGVSSWVAYIRRVLEDFSNLSGDKLAENPKLTAVPVQAYMASRAAAIDIRLIDPRAKDEPGSKVNQMIERLMGLYQTSTPYNGTQVVFADSFNSVRTSLFDAVTSAKVNLELDPAKEPGTTFNLYEDIRQKLIASGIPASEIAVITDSAWNSDKKKQALFDAVNEGKIRVVLGSTKKLGTGVNMQRLMIAAHHLDVPWTPAELEQRDGRVFRQGNIHGELGTDIELIRYGMSDTLDAALWQKLETKQRFSNAALSGKVTGRELSEDKAILNLEEQRAVLSGKYGRRMWEIKSRLEELDRSRGAQQDDAARRQAEIDSARSHLRYLEAANERIRPSIAKMESLASDIAANGTRITIDGQAFNTKTETAEAIKAALDASRSSLKLSFDGKQTAESVTNISVNGIPILLETTIRVDDQWNEEAQRMEQRSSVSFELLAFAADAENFISFGSVTSPATLLSRLEELGDTAKGLAASRENNLARTRAIANMAQVETWPYQAEYDALTAERVEVEKLYNADLKGKTDAVSDDTTLSAARTQPSPRVRFANAEITAEPTNITLGAARAYHGTPHKVDRFSADKIGTGEGAQAYGWGLYFAENKGVAEQYRKGLTEKDFIRKVRNVFSEFDDLTEQEEALLELPLSEGQRNLLDVLKKEDWWGFDYPHQAVQAALREPENFDTSPELYEALRTFGNIYTVELDVEPEDLLDWDKPLFEQSEKVKKALAKLSANKKHPAYKATSGMLLYGGAREIPASEFYKTVVKAVGTPEQASNFIQGLGIPGIRYLDEGSRVGFGKVTLKATVRQMFTEGYWVAQDGAGNRLAKGTEEEARKAAADYDAKKETAGNEPTYNYVVFDESLIKILAENGEQVGNAASASTLSAARRQVYDPNQLELDFDAAPRDQAAAQEDAEKSAAARFQSGLDGVMAMASTYSNIPGVDMDEVRQTARIALANAARAFDPQRGVPFGPYSSIVVRNKLNALYRRESLRRERIPQSLDEPLPGDFDETRQDYTPDTATPDAPTMTSRHEARILIDGLIATLPERMRVAVDGYLQQRQQEEIGGYFGISKQAVSRLQQEGFKRLRQKMTERGIGSVGEILSAAQKNPMTGTLGESIAEYGISGAIPLDTDTAMGSIGNRPSAQPSPNTAPVQSLDPGQTRIGIPAEDAFSKISYAPARVWGVRRLAERFEALRNSVGGYPIQAPIYRADYDAHQAAFREAAQAAERLYRDTLDAVDAANTRRRGTADYLLPRLPEVRELFTDANGQVQLLGSRPAQLEPGEPLFAASGNPQDDGDFIEPGESFDNDLKNLLNDLNGVPADLDNAAAKQEQAALEEGGGQSYQVGRPDLAFGANNPDVRGLDQFYTERFLPEAEAQWETAARDMVAKDFEGTRRSIEQAGLSGQAISPELTKAADQIANTLRQKMLQTGKDADRKAFNVFWYSYRATGTEAGRALAARRDPFKTPAMRHREFLLDLMLTPGKKDKARIDAEPDPAKKTAIIDSVTAALLKKLKDAGITPEDILGNRVVVGLNNAEIQRQFRAGLTPKQAEVFDLLLRKNQTPAQISQRTGMKPDAVEAVFTAFKNRMRQQHLAKFKAGIHKQGETTLGAAPAQSGLFGGQVSDAEAEAAFDQWLSGMVGTSDTKKIGRPKFRIDDPAHVMRLARAIQSARGEAGLGDMAYEWWIMNILSGPQTQVTNIASNAGFIALDSTLQRGMEALVNVFVRDKKAAQLGEFKALARGILPGITKGLAMAAKAWSAEQDFYEHTVLGTPMELGQWDKLGNTSAAIPGQTGRTVRIPGRALLFADSFFKQLSGQMNVAAFAYRMAKAEGLRGQALTTRVAQLSKTRGEIVSENLPSASPSQEMVEYFARQLARRDPSLDPAALMANRSSEAWELAREQAAYDSAKNAGWTEDAWIRAVEKSKEMTFQQDLKRSSEGGNLFEDATAKLQDARLNNKLIGFFFPFVRTPYNIFRTGIRKSPIGAANFAWQAGKGFLAMKDGKAFLDGDPTLVRDMSEQLIAWTAMALIFGAVQGDDDDDDKMLLITGSQPRSEATAGLRDLNTRATGGEYMIRIGGRNGITIPYGRFDPIATVLGTTTDLIRSIKRNGTTTENLASVWNYMVAQTNSKTFLQGIANISTILEGKSDPVGATKRTVLQALVPNIIRQPLRNLDDYVRDTKSAPATYTLFPSGDLAEPKVDVYGNEIRKGSNPVLRLFFNSALATEPVLEATDRLLMNWNRANPSMAYAPEQAKAVYKGRDGKEVEMTAEETRRFRLASGRLASVKLRAVATPARVANPTEDDIQAIRSAFSDARREVRERMFAGR